MNSLFFDVLGVIFILTGLSFDIIGCVGLIRLPDVYNRLAAATKCVAVGTCFVLFGTFLIMGWCPAGVKCLLCIAFIVLTSPVSSHAMARACHRSGIKLWEGAVADHYAEDKEGEA